MTCLSLDPSMIRMVEVCPQNPPNKADVNLLEEYEVMEVLGQGRMGVVRRASRRLDGQDVSLKTVRTSDPELFVTTHNEFALLKALQHPHIIRAYDCIHLSSGIVLVLEYFPGSNLQDAVRRVPSRRVHEGKARDLFMALMSAVAYLHENFIVHRDVKAQNVLVSDDLSYLRLVDFNTAQRVEDGGALSMTGTREWSAPEVLRGESPDCPQDVWGSGLCLLVLLYGRLPRVAGRCQSKEEYAESVVNNIGLVLGDEKLEYLTEAYKETLQSCLAVDLACRPAAHAVIQTSRWLATEEAWPRGPN